MNFSFVSNYQNLEFYNALILYHKYYPENFNYNFYIDFLYFSFPFSYWNGDINTNIDMTSLMYQDFVFIIESFKCPICLDISNFNLTETDLLDTKLNIILTLLNNTGSYIRVSNPNLISILKNKYNFFYILSDTYFLQEQELHQFFLPLISYQEINNINNKKLINNQNNIIFNINDLCNNCSKFKGCFKLEQFLQYNFSEKSQMLSCVTQSIDINKIHNFINNNKITYHHYKLNIYNLQNIITLLIKPEKQMDFLFFYKGDVLL